MTAANPTTLVLVRHGETAGNRDRRFQTYDTPLSDTGTLGPDGEGFRRRSCCLYYRVPGGGLCGDCVLGPLAARRGATRRLSPDR